MSAPPEDEEFDSDPESDIFVVNGKRVKFYLWGTQEEKERSWELSEGQREALRGKILRHGGALCGQWEDSQTVIVKQTGLEALRHRFRISRARYAELPSFIDVCIGREEYTHETVKQRPMGGRPPGQRKQQKYFTYEEDLHLCRYIADRIPDPDAGGRTGNTVYKELLDSARELPEFKWALEHPWESWRTRYKTQKDMLDPIIKRMVAENPPPADGKGLFEYDRRLNSRDMLRRHVAAMREEEEEEEEDEDEDLPAKNLEQDREGSVQGRDEGEDYPMGEFQPLEDDLGEDEGPQPNGKRRHTDHGTPRDRRPSNRRRQEKSLELDFDDEQYEFEVQPGPEDAGPSGTQRSPSLSPEVPPPPPQPPKRPPAPRPVVRSTKTSNNNTNQVPMSSQATLVGTQQPRDAPAKKRKKLKPAKEPAGVPLDQVPVAADRPPHRTENGKGKEKAREEDVLLDSVDEHDFGMDFEMVDMEDMPLGQTNEEERNVEELLEQISNGGVTPEFEGLDGAATDSDDARALEKLLPGRARPMEDEDEEDDETFANGLNLLDIVAPRAVRPPAQSQPQKQSGQQAQNAGTPVALRTRNARTQLLSLPVRAEGYSSSSESAVPLTGTRAHAEKKKQQRADPYTPPSGTRAAEILRLQQRAQREAIAEVEGDTSVKINLRTRTVRKG